MTTIYQLNYAYTLNFREDQIEKIAQLYKEQFEYAPRPIEDKFYGHMSHNFVDLVVRCIPELQSYVDKEGAMAFVLAPDTSTNIHIDQRRDMILRRNIVINFPIVITKSVTSFYPEPSAKFVYQDGVAYTTGIYFSEPAPIFSYEMEKQAVLLNTAKYHKVSNISTIDIRIILSIPMNPDYTFNQSLSILKSLGYAN